MTIIFIFSVLLGAFIGSGEIAIANNILDLTARIQRWPLDSLPDLTQGFENFVFSCSYFKYCRARCCKFCFIDTSNIVARRFRILFLFCFVNTSNIVARCCKILLFF